MFVENIIVSFLWNLSQFSATELRDDRAATTRNKKQDRNKKWRNKKQNNKQQETKKQETKKQATTNCQRSLCFLVSNVSPSFNCKFTSNFDASTDSLPFYPSLLSSNTTTLSWNALSQRCNQIFEQLFLIISIRAKRCSCTTSHSLLRLRQSDTRKALHSH